MKIPFQQYLSTKWPAILWSVFVFILLAMPMSFFPHERKLSVSQLDKIVHILLFAVLSFLWTVYLKKKYQGQFKFKKKVILVFFLTVAFGIAMEYVQLYTGRDFDVWDMVADAVGSFTGISVFVIKNKPR